MWPAVKNKVLCVAALLLLKGGLLVVAGKQRERQQALRRKELDRLDIREFDEDNCLPSDLENIRLQPQWGCAEIADLWDNRGAHGLQFIGNGYWRDVYEGHYGGQHIVYKHLKEKHERTDRNIERHRHEALALQATADSPYVVHLLGYCDSEVVTAHMPRALEDMLFDNYDPAELRTDAVLRIALDAARGVAALHDAPGGPIVHTDLQPRQFLFDRGGTLRLNDLNRCRLLRRHAATREQCAFRTYRANGVWRAPEEFAMIPLDEKLDIYSLGLIFYALASGRAPFERDDDEAYKRAVLAGARPPVDPAWHPGFAALMQEMWAQRASRRPAAADVVRRLEAMVAALDGGGGSSGAAESLRASQSTAAAAAAAADAAATVEIVEMA